MYPPNAFRLAEGSEDDDEFGATLAALTGAPKPQRARPAASARSASSGGLDESVMNALLPKGTNSVPEPLAPPLPLPAPPARPSWAAVAHAQQAEDEEEQENADLMAAIQARVGPVNWHFGLF